MINPFQLTIIKQKVYSFSILKLPLPILFFILFISYKIVIYLKSKSKLHILSDLIGLGKFIEISKDDISYKSFSL